MVPRAGFEPATLGLEVLCSIQLSYRGVRCAPGIYIKPDRAVSASIIAQGCPPELPGRICYYTVLPHFTGIIERDKEKEGI